MDLPLEGLSAGTILAAIMGNLLVRAVGGLLLCDFLTGVAVAIKERQFRLGALMDWMAPTALYFVGGIIVQLLVWSVDPSLGGPGASAANLVWLGICGAVIGKVLTNVNRLLPPTINLPAALQDRIKPTTEARP